MRLRPRLPVLAALGPLAFGALVFGPGAPGARPPAPAPTGRTVAPPSVPREGAPADTTGDRARLARLAAFADRDGLADRPFGDAVVALGRQFRGAPYVAGLLDASADETLTAPLDRFDCVLFVETTLALARGFREGDRSYAGYLRRVEDQRYRGGRLDGYGSRLHYFTDWIADGEARGLVDDVTADAGGVRYAKRFDFMTRNRARYPHLADPAAFAAVAAAERRLAAGERTYVPKARVRAAYPHIEAGDVIATTTDLAGLDVTHVGFATVAADGTVGFLHASPSGGVKTAPDLAAYLAGNPRQTGIFVVRPRP